MARPSLKEKIIEASIETFHVQGFNASSVQNITAAAGAPKGSLFNHFKNKELLALEALSRYHESNRPEMLLDEASPPLKRLRRHFEFLANRYREWEYDRSCMIGSFGAEAPISHIQIRGAVRDIYVVWSGLIATVLLEAQTEKEIDPQLDVQQLARFLLNAWEGTLIRMKTEKSDIPLDDFFSISFDFILS